MELSYFAIIIGAIFVNNVVLAQFLGICPFLGVSSKVETSLGMGAAVTFVMAIAAVVAWLIQTSCAGAAGHRLHADDRLHPRDRRAGTDGRDHAQEDLAVALYQALGIFLPLITTNCAVLGVAILMIQKEFNLLQASLIRWPHGPRFRPRAGALREVSASVSRFRGRAQGVQGHSPSR